MTNLLLILCYSLEKGISFARENDFDGFVAVGGGSVMDSAKAINLIMCHPDKQLLDFVAPPIGGGQQPSRPLRPLICGMNYWGRCWEIKFLGSF